MYLKRLKVRNIRLLSEQEFSFVDGEGKPRHWTVILGDNGLCKSTILQSVALASLGPKLAGSVLRDAQSLRSADADRKASASIEAEFLPPRPNGLLGDVHHQAELRVELEIHPSRHDFVSGESTVRASEYLDTVRAQRTRGWFTVGYGVGRFLPRPGEVALPPDPTIDRVEGLFDSRHKMLGIDFY